MYKRILHNGECYVCKRETEVYTLGQRTDQNNLYDKEVCGDCISSSSQNLGEYYRLVKLTAEKFGRITSIPIDENYILIMRVLANFAIPDESFIEDVQNIQESL